MQSPRTRPGHFATRVGTHQLRGRRARAAHSIAAVAIAFHATRRRAASGSAPLGGPNCCTEQGQTGRRPELAGPRFGEAGALWPRHRRSPAPGKRASLRSALRLPSRLLLVLLYSLQSCPSVSCAYVAAFCSACPMCSRLCKRPN